jgi:hypothetical protein
MTGSGDPLTLSREDLYELAWSKPMTELAQDFGLSDVALAKRCRKLGVPIPGRGYWARVAAGQTPRQPALRKRADDVMDYAALTFDSPREETPPEATPATAEQHPLFQKVQSLQLAYSDELRLASPAVKRTAARLKRPWRSEITWNRGERQGPVISIDVTESCADRALKVSEQIIASAAALRWAFKAPPKREESRPNRYEVERREPPVFGCLYVENEALAFRIDERAKRIDHELTDSEKARRRRGESIYPPRWDHVPTGELRLYVTRANSTHPARTWKDGARLKLEEQTKSVLLALLEIALSIKIERERQRLAEIGRRRQEKLEWEQTERRTANATLIHELEAQAGGWLRARFLRSYLRALRRTVEREGLQGLVAKRQEETVDFLAWAQHYVDQLDPLCTTPHDADFEAERPGYYMSADKQVHETLDRLLGNHWSEAFKVGRYAPDEPPPSPGSIALGTSRRRPRISPPAHPSE